MIFGKLKRISEATTKKTLRGTQCYKDKKYREAIGKYHRALLEIKGLCRVLGDPDTGSKPPSSLLTTICKSTTLTDEQKGAMENAELECYNSLAVVKILVKSNKEFIYKLG
uniref:Uncharacterized protein n=1 Tax=Mola mola TaxID=94237 RepID=A0A3Q3WDD3_MOLML